jgi:EmrB/QacA subfamily drug resistance transporter
MDARRQKRWTLVAAILGLSVTILDETVVFLALPAIERDLQIGLTGQQWVVNGYLLSLSALLLVGGSLADLVGRRRVFLIGMAGFGAASLAAGLAPSGGVLVAARIVQGAFAALAMPATLAVVIACFRGEGRPRRPGADRPTALLAAAIGPLVAGVLIGTLSWRWVFFLSLPIVAATIALGLWAIEESRDDQRTAQDLDLLGALLAILAIGGFSFAVVQGAEIGWDAPAIIAAAIGSVVAFAAFLARERRARAPMLPLGLFRSRNFSAANAATLTLYGVFNGNFFVLLIFLQSALDYTALAAGAATLPITLLMLTLSSRVGRLSERTGARLPMAVGQTLVAGGLLLLGFLEPGDEYLLQVLPGVVVFGLGLALTVAPLTNTAVSAVSESQSGIASGVNNAAARLAGLLAVAALGVVFAVAFRASLDAPAGSGARAAVLQRAEERPTTALDLRIEPSVRAEVQPALRRASVDAYRAAMWTGVGVALLGALVSVLGVRDRRPPQRPARRAVA